MVASCVPQAGSPLTMYNTKIYTVKLTGSHGNDRGYVRGYEHDLIKEVIFLFFIS